MKKLGMLFIVAAMTGMVGAASFDWKVTTGAGYDDANIYAFTGTTAADVLATCQRSDAAAWAAMFDGVTGFGIVGNTARTSVNGSTGGIEADDNLVFVIVDGEIAEGSTYTVFGDYSIPGSSVYVPPAKGTALALKLSDLTIVGSDEFVSVPEPTSGILLLLGVAGLALKRKHV